MLVSSPSPTNPSPGTCGVIGRVSGKPAAHPRSLTTASLPPKHRSCGAYRTGSPPSESPALSGSTLRYRMQYFSSGSLVRGTMKVIHAAGERGRQQQQTAGGRRSAGAGRGRGDYAVKFRGFSRFTRPHLFSFLGMVRTLNVAPRNVIHFPTTLLSR